MDEHKQFINRAAYLTTRSPMRRFASGAALVRRGEILTEGWSHIGSPLKELYSIHSEIMALGRARHLDLNGTIVYVATRSCKSGNLTLAKPCITCAIALAAAGVQTAYFTINNNEYDVIDLNEDLETLKLYRASPGIKLAA